MKTSWAKWLKQFERDFSELTSCCVSCKSVKCECVIQQKDPWYQNCLTTNEGIREKTLISRPCKMLKLALDWGKTCRSLSAASCTIVKQFWKDATTAAVKELRAHPILDSVQCKEPIAQMNHHFVYYSLRIIINEWLAVLLGRVALEVGECRMQENGAQFSSGRVRLKKPNLIVPDTSELSSTLGDSRWNLWDGMCKIFEQWPSRLISK